jgi:aminopeptidase C
MKKKALALVFSTLSPFSLLHASDSNDSAAGTTASPPSPRSPFSTYFPEPLVPDAPIYATFLQQLIAKTGVAPIKSNPDIREEYISTQYNVDPGKPTDQKSSGRCWIFSTLNMLRIPMLATYGKDFAYSQNYLSFWDKYERANAYFERIIALRHSDVASQEMQNVLEHFYTEGGEWVYAKNLIKKYGLVPAKAMPESEFSGNSAGYMDTLKERTRELGGLMHRKLQSGASREEILLLKSIALKEIKEILVTYLGAPPTSFLWRNNSKEALQRFTPLEFAAQNTFKLDDMVQLMNLPYVAERAYIVSPTICNVLGGECLKGFSVGMKDLKAAVRASIKDGKSVLFSAEVKRFDREKKLFSLSGDRSQGILGIHSHLRLSKGDRLRYHATSVAHGMTIVGCDDENPAKVASSAGGGSPDEYLGAMWKIENSWKDLSELYMTDAWVDEYLYGVVVDKKYLSPELQALLDDPATPVHEVPSWDPYSRV